MKQFDRELQEALEFVGAEICEFGPDDDDECETCGESNKQLYYRRTGFDVDEGEYHCEDCIKKMPELWQEEADSYEERIEKILDNGK